jgi:hypothetical protein
MLLLDSTIQTAASISGRIAPAQTGFGLPEGFAVSDAIVTIDATQG